MYLPLPLSVLLLIAAAALVIIANQMSALRRQQQEILSLQKAIRHSLLNLSARMSTLASEVDQLRAAMKNRPVVHLHPLTPGQERRN